MVTVYFIHTKPIQLNREVIWKWKGYKTVYKHHFSSKYNPNFPISWSMS